MKKNKGITIISLVITIVVLIILASVAIYLALSNNGIFNRAKEAKEVTNKQEATEIINLKITTAQMNKYTEEQRMPTLKELSEALIDDEIEYVTEESQVASTKYEVGENPTSIFTKLNKYPYEFEINSHLQLASIDGVKIAKDDKNSNGIDLLWTNDNPNTEFTAQTITMDLSDYEAILVYVKNWSKEATTLDPKNCVAYAYVKVGESTYCTSIGKGTAGWCGYYRKVNVESNGIEFESGKYGQKSSEYSHNSAAIPLHIWGVKKDIYENSNL